MRGMLEHFSWHRNAPAHFARMLLFRYYLAAERGDQHGDYGNNQNGAREGAQDSQRINSVNQSEHTTDQEDADKDNHIAYNEIVDGFDNVHGPASSNEPNSAGFGRRASWERLWQQQ